MGFNFSYVCDYLEAFEQITCHNPPLSPQESRARFCQANKSWFASHRKAVDCLDDKGSSALVSTFLPLKRKDRIYGLQSTSLLKLLGRCLSLGFSGRQVLAAFQSPGNGDLGECLQRLLNAGGPPAVPSVTVQEVDEMLQNIASHNRFSAPTIQQQQSFPSSGKTEHPLRGILLRLKPLEAKWLVRSILKDFSPITLDEQLFLRSFHFLLPDISAVQSELDVACSSLRSLFGEYPSQPDPQSRRILRQLAGASFKPIPGVMVSRSEFCKARSIKHCLQLTTKRKWLVERKYDGEYCQIHIDLSKGNDWLKVYSKSGRDSTKDREGLRDTIQKCLRIGTDRCRFKKHAILVGELVVFSDIEDRILPFDNIRNHVSRAGVFLGANQDSAIHHGEHLMIILFDLLLLDDEPLLSLSVEERKARLHSVFKRIKGRAAPAESRVLDFSEADSEHRLVKQFAASIAHRHEGLVLKPCGVPYLSMPYTVNQSLGFTSVIKLKKDYIVNLGDEADFALLGASYNAQEAKKRPNLRLRFTHFHLGCLVNKTTLQQNDVRPCFKFVATIAYDQCMSTDILERFNEGQFLTESFGSGAPTFDIKADQEFRMDHYFRDPPVLEVLGSSYCKPAGSGYMLRHPRVKKLHEDRTWRDSISYDELQAAATEALNTNHGSESQENLNWIQKLEKSHKKKIERRSLNTTPRSSAYSMSPLTPTSVQASRKSRGIRGSSRPSRSEPETMLQNKTKRKLFAADVGVYGDENAPLPTPPESSPMCAHLPNKPAVVLRKRYSQAVEEVTSKRHCVELSSSPRPAHFSPLQIQRRRSAQNEYQPSTDQPLSDVTERPLQRMGPRMECRDQRCEKTTREPERNVCVLGESVVHMHGFTDTEQARVRDVVLKHGAVVVEDVKFWERDEHMYEHLADTIGESQAYPGLRKMILVDGRNPEQVRACLAQIKGLKLRGVVEIYDYRLTEAICSKEREHMRTADLTMPRSE